MGRSKPIGTTLLSCIVFFSVTLSFAQSANVAYTYDELNRLIRVEYGDGTAITYTYDAAGNRTALAARRPETATLTINGASADFTIAKGAQAVIKAKVPDNAKDSTTKVTVTARFSTGDPAMPLFDDGAHDDGVANDGVYTNTWIPDKAGPCTIMIHVSRDGLNSVGTQVGRNVTEGN